MISNFYLVQSKFEKPRTFKQINVKQTKNGSTKKAIFTLQAPKRKYIWILMNRTCLIKDDGYNRWTTKHFKLNSRKENNERYFLISNSKLFLIFCEKKNSDGLISERTIISKNKKK